MRFNFIGKFKKESLIKAMLIVNRQLKSGQVKSYAYSEINGKSVREYMCTQSKTHRRKLKQDKGLLPVIHPREVPLLVVQRIVKLRNSGESWATIARLVHLSEYISKRAYQICCPTQMGSACF